MNVARRARRTFRKLFRRGGHGVHSPFAYHLLTRVVEERAHYTAYEDLLKVAEDARSSQQAIREALFLYRLLAHYPISQITYAGAHPLFEKAVELSLVTPSSGVARHIYGPYTEEDRFRFIAIDNDADLPSLNTLLEEPTLLLLSITRNSRLKEWAHALYECLPYGIEVDFLSGKLFVLTPKLFKKSYKTTL